MCFFFTLKQMNDDQAAGLVEFSRFIVKWERKKTCSNHAQSWTCFKILSASHLCFDVKKQNVICFKIDGIGQGQLLE